MDQSSKGSDSHAESNGIVGKEHKNSKTDINDSGKSQTRCSNKDLNGVENNFINLMNQQSSDADNSISDDRLNDIVQHPLNGSDMTELSSNPVSDVRESSDDTSVVDDADRADESNSVEVPENSSSDSDWISDNDTDGSDNENDYGSSEYGGDSDDGNVYDSDSDINFSIENFELNDSIREAIRQEMIERNTSVFKYKIRDGVTDVCSICLSTFAGEEDLRRLPCFHYFHIACVDNWLKNDKTVCPSCRLNINNTADYLNESAL